MLQPRHTCPALVSLFIASSLVLATVPASAAVLTALQFNVYRDGGSADWLLGNNRLLGDAFDNNDPYLGPNYTGFTTPAAYALQGLADGADAALAVRETGGALLLDPNYGAVSANAQGGLGTSIRLRLLTNIVDANSGLPRSRSFAGALRLSLAALPDVGQNFGLRLSDSFSNNNDVIELSASGSASGTTITFRKQDFVAGTVTALGSAALVAPVGADALLLSISHATANTDTIFGSYAYADASGALIGSYTTFASSTTAFDGEAYGRFEVRATGPVPEPGSWALLAAGLGGLSTRLRRQV